MPEATLHFPPDFAGAAAPLRIKWKAATRTTIWYAWEQGEGHIADEQKSGLACDWWNKAEADLKLAAAIWARTRTACRSSGVASSRGGRWDDAAIDRYREMLRVLRAQGIEPMVTPAPLYDPAVAGGTGRM